MPKLQARNLSVLYGRHPILEPTDVAFEEGRLCALIGPESIAKTTFLRAFNRLLGQQSGMQVYGKILLDDANINAIAPLELTRRVGMVFPEPAPFAGSIEDNIAYGLRLRGEKKLPVLREAIEFALKEADLWSYRDSLNKKVRDLTIEQQQRVCIARVLALRPEVLLMDEPFMRIDTGSRLHIEELIQSLRGRYTVLLAVSNMELAGRISDDAAFLMDGNLLEFGPTEEIFYRPKHQRTMKYITGRLT